MERLGRDEWRLDGNLAVRKVGLGIVQYCSVGKRLLVATIAKPRSGKSRQWLYDSRQSLRVWLTSANREMTAVRQRERMPMYEGQGRGSGLAVSRTGVGEAYVPYCGMEQYNAADECSTYPSASRPPVTTERQEGLRK